MTVPPPIQFDRADFNSNAIAPCVACKRPPQAPYYTANGKIICAPCHQRFLASTTGGSPFPRLFRAFLFGLGAAIAGAILWYAVQKITNSEFGIIAILVGYMVGTAVRKGSHRRGGPPYQIIAVVLTYISIVLAYVPLIFPDLPHDLATRPATVLLATGLFIFKFIPILIEAKDYIGLLIIAFALFEAWKLNRSRSPIFTGPHPLSRSAPPAPTTLEG
ncbi:MAG TPA: hypothetical protein VFE58_19565 [Tepidisphaeraceae bacterium]|jgi:hypothetical protein|nr:hypothetical protein [Tepidisphaeraceae bacterium]